MGYPSLFAVARQISYELKSLCYTLNMNRGGSVSSVDKNAGFTIVETLIVLAVTSALFVSAMVLISGKQARTEFQIGARQLEQQIRSQINQTENGYYTSRENFSCSRSGATVAITSASGRERGTSGECVLAGAAFRFAAPDTWQLVSMAATRIDASGNINTSLANAKVVVPTLTNTPLPAGFSFKQGAVYRLGSARPASLNSPFVFLVLSDVTAANSDTSSVQPLVLRGFAGAPPYPVLTDDTLSSSRFGVVASRVELCFTGGIQKSVLITIGGTSGVAVSSAIKEGDRC